MTSYSIPAGFLPAACPSGLCRDRPWKYPKFVPVRGRWKIAQKRRPKEASDESDHSSRVHDCLCSPVLDNPRRDRSRPSTDPTVRSQGCSARVDCVHSRIRQSGFVVPGVDRWLSQLRPDRQWVELFEHRDCLPAGSDQVHDPQGGRQLARARYVGRPGDLAHRPMLTGLALLNRELILRRFVLHVRRIARGCGRPTPAAANGRRGDELKAHNEPGVFRNSPLTAVLLR
jgi:hypothetical protein